MDELRELEKNIENTRKKLCKTIEEKQGILMDPEVIEISKLLDGLLVNYEQMLKVLTDK